MTEPKRPVLLSGVQPTSGLTLGNYIGAIRNWVALQDAHDCIFMAVDLHSITVRQDPRELRENTYRLLANYLAAGVDPGRCTLVVQSHVPQHAELAWVLTCYSTMGELGRMTQFKDKGGLKGENVFTGLFTYPALMAADILLYRTELVPVGEDQKQHLELSRDLCERLNNLYGPDLFVMPKPFIAKVGARIMDLQDPTSKMSKSSRNPGGAVFLDDSDDQIAKKIKRAVTDSGSTIRDDESQPGVRNLLNIQAALTGRPMSEIVAGYERKQYGHLKVDTADIVVQALRPIRERARTLLEDRGSLEAILKRGAEAARARASTQLAMVYERLGFIRI